MSSPNREFKCKICGALSTHASKDDINLCDECEDDLDETV